MATNQWHPPCFKVMITLTTFKRLTLLQGVALAKYNVATCCTDNCDWDHNIIVILIRPILGLDCLIFTKNVAWWLD